MVELIFTEASFCNDGCLKALRESELLLFAGLSGLCCQGQHLRSCIPIVLGSTKSLVLVLSLLPRVVVAWLLGDIHSTFLTVVAVVWAEVPSFAVFLNAAEFLIIF